MALLGWWLPGVEVAEVLQECALPARVLALVAAGQSSQHIAEALRVTTKTIAYHVANILSKLDVVSRLEAVVWVYQHLPDDLVILPG